MQKSKLVILSDYGLDDACALAYLLRHRERFSAIDIVAVAGNTSAENSLTNLNKLLNALSVESGRADFYDGITVVDTREKVQPHAHLPSIHGDDGMGDLFENCDMIKTVGYSDWLKNLSGRYVLFSAGPCTLTVEVTEKCVPVSTVIMAGVVNEKPNYEGKEFNQALDVNAYNASVAKNGVAVATLDTCRNKRFNLAGKRMNDGSVFARLVNRACELAEARHKDNCYIYDYIAALYLITPESFSVVSRVDPWGNTVAQIEVSGEVEF